MTKITPGKGTHRTYLGHGKASKSGKPQTSGFQRALVAGKSKVSSTAAPETRIALGAKASQNDAAAAKPATPSPVYETTRILPAIELVSEFKVLKAEVQGLLSRLPVDQAPSIAIVHRSGGDDAARNEGSMQQIGGTIFVDHGVYEGWKSGTGGSQFETGLYQMIEARANSSH
ncbi:MAG: hypothetical protein AAF441_05315 [Pseudomonadota bacterium]